jgi:predicted RNA-binding Zn ribbon-like protein
MGGRHPVDSHGRALPHADWPADRQAPGRLELVRRFCNSVNRENGAERFHDAEAFDAWLVGEGVGPTGASDADLGRVIAVREVLHRLVVANAAGAGHDSAWSELVALLPAHGLGFTAGGRGLGVTSASSGVDGFLAHLGLTVTGAVDDGSWGRLKACRHCQWVVFDPSKNRSARWCSMSACGGRQNAKAYRRRRSSRAS